MIDHFGINCSDLAASAAFYDKVLGTLGLHPAHGLRGGRSATAPTSRTSGSATFEGRSGPNREIHVAFARPPTPSHVRAFHAAATELGAEVAARAADLAGVPRALLRRVRARPRRQQRRGRLPHRHRTGRLRAQSPVDGRAGAGARRRSRRGRRRPRRRRRARRGTTRTAARPRTRRARRSRRRARRSASTPAPWSCGRGRCRRTPSRRASTRPRG